MYYIPHSHVLAKGSSKMAHWRKRLFIVMARNARSIAESFGVPPDQAIELGTQVDL
ncbi:MAG: KUP/HAK/KT family potassium transporter [Gemmatimonadaceae bacterium]